MTNSNVESVEDKKLLRKMFWRSFLLYGSYNPVRASGISFLYAILPFLRKYYPDKQERIGVMKRNAEYYNITSALSTFPMAIVASMEKENSKTHEFTSESINAIKASLMGPLSGIGDSFFWGTFRVIAAGIGITLAKQGSILGPILFLILFNIPAILTRYYGAKIGFNVGEKYIKRIFENGTVQILSKSAAMLGIMMVGAMIYTTVTVKSGLKFNLGGISYKLQTILDEILKGSLPLAATGICFYFIHKKVNPTIVMIGIIIIGFILSLIGLI